MGKLDDLERLQKLKECEAITEKEFEIEKKKILADDIEVVNEDTPLTKKVCSKCGNELFEEDRFCGKCGNKVNEEAINEKMKTNKVSSKSPIKIKLNYAVLVVAIITILLIGGILGGIYYKNTIISEAYLTSKFKENGFSQFDDVNVQILDIEDIYYKNFNKLVLAKSIVTNNNVEISNVGFLLVNKKENNVESFTINNQLMLLLNGVAENNISKVQEITKVSARYIQMSGTDIFQRNETDDFRNLINEYSTIIGLKESKDYIKKGFAKQTNENLDYTLLFEKQSPIIKYIAFYETTTKYNTNYPCDEKMYQYFKKDYSHRDSINALEYVYGPAYITVQEYTVYEIGEVKNAQDFEKMKVGSYSTLEKAKASLNVEE